MGHMGMQASRKLEQSGFGFKGRSADEAFKIVEEARALVDAGIFAMIIEYVPVEITQNLAKTHTVPVFSVGGGHSPDGNSLIKGGAVGTSACPRHHTRGERKRGRGGKG